VEWGWVSLVQIHSRELILLIGGNIGDDQDRQMPLASSSTSWLPVRGAVWCRSNVSSSSNRIEIFERLWKLGGKKRIDCEDTATRKIPVQYFVVISEAALSLNADIPDSLMS